MVTQESTCICYGSYLLQRLVVVVYCPEAECLLSPLHNIMCKYASLFNCEHIWMNTTPLQRNFISDTFKSPLDTIITLHVFICEPTILINVSHKEQNITNSAIWNSKRGCRCYPEGQTCTLLNIQYC